jgi:type I restriction enzyme R subunit
MPAYTADKERTYQDKVLSWFRAPSGLNYAYLGALQYPKGGHKTPDGRTNDPVLEDELRAFLQSQGKTPLQIETVVARVRAETRLPKAKLDALLDRNAAFYDLVASGIKARPTPSETEQDVPLFDFDYPENNRFAVAEEVSYIDPLTGLHSRPDIVVYVNGIALAVIELKRSIVSVIEGIRQHLSNECDLIPSFFTPVQFTVAANPKPDRTKSDTTENIGFKYGTIGTPARFWCNWKEDHQAVGTQLGDEESFRAFFDKATFLFLVRYGVLHDGGVKKVVRPHQFHALQAARPRLTAKASGVVWHSQGSGKSLTMVWLARYIQANFDNPRVLVVTDRTELDEQIAGNFARTANALHRATSKEDLLDTLNGGTEWLVCSLVHKFGIHSGTQERETDRETKIPLDQYLEELRALVKARYPGGFRVKGNHIFVFVDECHRTQGGSLHEAMKEILGQDVMLIGFTGTPLLRDDKKKGFAAFAKASERRFGPFIHTYLHKEAVDDKVVLDLQYEARDVEQRLDSPAKVDEKFAALAAGLPEDRVTALKERWATLEKVYSSRDRIERIGWSVLDDVKNHPVLKQDWANAMLVAGDIYSAYRYYDFFQNNQSDTTLRGKCAVVTSYDPTAADLRKQTSDPNVQTENHFKYNLARQTFFDAGYDPDHFDAADYEKWAKDRFLHKPAQLKLLIVVDKLLTGFDAPTATVLYIDKEMRDHTLFQAICRVNRLGADVKDPATGAIVARTHKQFGLIVDFKRLFGKIEDAVTRFNDPEGGLGGFDPADIDGLLGDAVAKNKSRLEAARKAFSILRSEWVAHDLAGSDAVAEFYTTDFPDDPAKERRTGMYAVTQALVSAYANLADWMPRAGYSTDEAKAVRSEAVEARQINLFVKQASGDFFDPNQYDPGMRAILDQYVRADDADVIVPATADFSFLDLLSDDTSVDEAADKATAEAGSEKAAAEVIAAKARAVINSHRDKDPAAYDLFSAQLQSILDSLKAGRESFRKQMLGLLALIKAARNGGASFPTGVRTPLARSLWNNRATWYPAAPDDAAVIARIADFENMLEFDAMPEWRDRTTSDSDFLRADMATRYPDLSEDALFELYSLAVQNAAARGA